MTRYTMPGRSQGNACVHHMLADMERNDTHRWIFVYSMSPDVESLVRKWLSLRLDGFYCDLQTGYTPHFTSPETQARTHIVLHEAPPPQTTLAKGDEVASVNAYGLNALETAKSVIKAIVLNPHMSVIGWPFCLNELEQNGKDI